MRQPLVLIAAPGPKRVPLLPAPEAVAGHSHVAARHPVAHHANAARVPDVIENLLVHGTARSRAAAGCQQAITSSARTTWPKNWSMLCSVASCSRWVNVAVQSLVKTT
jgi:hypothetical protein